MEQEQGEDSSAGVSYMGKGSCSRKWAPDILVIPITAAEMRYATDVARLLRRELGVNVELHLNAASSLGSSLADAHRRGIPQVVLVGEDEATRRTITIRWMADRRQETVLLDSIRWGALLQARDQQSHVGHRIGASTREAQPASVA